MLLALAGLLMMTSWSCLVRRHFARSVLVDTEGKVLADSVAKGTRSWWSYKDAEALLDRSGAGNNWARGFSYYGSEAMEPCLNLLRRQVRIPVELQ